MQKGSHLYRNSREQNIVTSEGKRIEKTDARKARKERKPTRLENVTLSLLASQNLPTKQQTTDRLLLT